MTMCGYVNETFLNLILYLFSKLPSSLTKGYDPVHIPSLHRWYISRQNLSRRGAPSNGGNGLFPLRFRLINHILSNDIEYFQNTRVRWSPSFCNSSS